MTSPGFPTFDADNNFRVGNPGGKSYRELVGEPRRSIPAIRLDGALRFPPR